MMVILKWIRHQNIHIQKNELGAEKKWDFFFLLKVHAIPTTTTYKLASCFKTQNNSKSYLGPSLEWD